jgi:nitroreductase
MQEASGERCLSLLLSRREVREYEPRPVPEPIVERILEAGRMAGSAKNRQPWAFILIRERQRLVELAAFGQSAQHLKQAAFAVVIARRDEYLQDPFDAGRAAQNMMLAAHFLGLGSCPATLHDQEGARRFLGVPEHYVIQVCIAFGYPVPKKRMGRVVRRPLQELLHIERW